MQNGNRKSRGWPYVLTGVLFAGICAWISYNDGLFVARLAGNHDALAFFYPLLPDGLIVLCLLALAEAARGGVSRSRWAVAGLLLGIALTLAMNTYAGVEHSALDAVLDGMVPVVFFIAAEVVLWHVRHSRQAPAPEAADPAASRSVPSSVLGAAKASMAATVAAGNPWSQNQLQAQFGLTRAQAREIRAEFVPAGRAISLQQVSAMTPAGTPMQDERGRGGSPTGDLSPAPAAQSPPAGAVPSLNGNGRPSW